MASCVLRCILLLPTLSTKTIADWMDPAGCHYLYDRDHEHVVPSNNEGKP